MKPIEIRRLECVGCGAKFTAPSGINPIAHEFTEIRTISIPKKLYTINTDGKKTLVTTNEWMRDKNNTVRRTLELHKRLNPKNQLGTQVVKDDDTEYVVKITRAMKEAILEMDSTTFEDSKEVTLKCPDCGKVAYVQKMK